MIIPNLLQRLIATTFALSLFTASAIEDEKKETLTIEEAKFQMVQIYLAEKPPPKSLRTKYPELRKADQANRTVSKELRDAIQAHPQLKERFEKINQTKASIAAKAKLRQPLFAEAETLLDLEPLRKKYHKTRLHALNLEIEAHQSEGHTDLAKKLRTIFRKIAPRSPAKGK